MSKFILISLLVVFLVLAAISAKGKLYLLKNTALFAEIAHY